MIKNTTDKLLTVALNSEYGNRGFKTVVNPDYIPQTDETYIVSALLLCTECKQPIKATINSPQWIKCEWIGPAGECLKCSQAAKLESPNRISPESILVQDEF